MKKFAKTCEFCCALLLLSLNAALAAPNLVNYQGVLTDSDGLPVNATVEITFALFDEATGGVELWSEAQSVAVQSGSYSVLLGSINPFGATVFDNDNLWLELIVAGEVLSPRQRLASAPYALRAASIAAGSQLIVPTSASNPGLVVKGEEGQLADLQQWQNNVGEPVASVGATGDLSISGNFNLPATTATTGAIKAGGAPLMHTYGYQNFFAGSEAGNFTMDGSYNTGVGYHALINNANGNGNTAIGSGSLEQNTKGVLNTASGQSALKNNTTASGNSALGTSALYNQSYDNSGAYYYTDNTAVGGGALYSNNPVSVTTGINNTAIGFFSLYFNTIGNSNTAIGYSSGVSADAGNANTTGSNNTFIGSQAGPGTPTQLTNATAIGANAKVSASDSLVLGSPGVKVGIGTSTPTESLDVAGNLKVSGTVESGGINLPTGTLMLGSPLIIKDGSGEKFIFEDLASFYAGHRAGKYSNNAFNTGVGTEALYANSEGGRNTAIGATTLNKNIRGNYNLAAGDSALFSNTSGSKNTALGARALFSQAYANFDTAWDTFNTAVGYESLFANDPIGPANGYMNTSTGALSLRSNNTGHGNTANGYNALTANTTGSDNTAVGISAGSSGAESNTTGSRNTFIGALSRPLAGNLSNATAIGYGAAVSQSNSLILGGTGANAVKVGIGTVTPSETLDVVGGNIRINDNKVYLRVTGDNAHGLGWYTTGGFSSTPSANPDGPVLFGYGGGTLGTTQGGNKVLMAWKYPSDIDVYGYTRFHLLSGGSTAVCLDANGTLSTCSSDERMKKDVVALSEEMDVLDVLSKLRGVTFAWDKSNDKTSGMADGRDLGMIAQEVEPFFPEIVHTDVDGYRSLDYPKLVAFLIEVNKAQQAQLATYQNDISSLGQAIKELSTRLSAMEAKHGCDVDGAGF